MRRLSAFALVAYLAACVVSTHVSTAADDAQTALAWAQTSTEPAAPSAASLRDVINQYCITCHNERLKTAGLVLNPDAAEHVAENPEVWEKVLRKLRSRTMPPQGIRRPDDAKYETLVSKLESDLDAFGAMHPNPGRVTTHRLNRTEYANVIRDLLGVEVDVRSLLPSDDGAYGFDNNADVLSLTPALLDRYLAAARKVVTAALGDVNARPTITQYKLPEAPVLMQDDRLDDDLPFGSRGGMAVHYTFPADGEYRVKIRLQRLRDGQGEIRGMYEPTQIDLRLDDKRVRLFSVGRQVTNPDGTLVEPELLSVNLNVVTPETEYDIAADAGLEAAFQATAGEHIVGVTFVKKGYEPEWIFRPNVTDFGYVRNKGGNPDVDTVEIAGPYNVAGVGDTPSRSRILICRPARQTDERACVNKILTQLARRAYRRAVAQADIADLESFFDETRRTSGFEDAIKAALVRMLVDPEFLFRLEHDSPTVPAGEAYRISDTELASRLSFFLWSSIPDDELLGLAARGKLSDPAVLQQQARRMLADDRAHALVTNFGGQWLYVRNVRSLFPDRQIFPEFDENLRAALARETELFLENAIRKDRSVVDLLSADETYLNERLARHYGIPNIYGSHFRRVPLPKDDPRAGLLGQGSILTATSYATRTSPVLRGKWLLDNMLGAPPPPPPPNVPPLNENGDGGKPLTMRAAMEEHRKNPACAVCHARMDPLGFALENFNAIGEWRTTDAGSPVDASGTLPDGTKFSGAVELRSALLKHRRDFVLAVTEKLLTYALGRGLEYYDAPTVRRITREAELQNYSWSSLILAIVRSTPFQMRMAES